MDHLQMILVVNKMKGLLISIIFIATSCSNDKEIYSDKSFLIEDKQLNKRVIEYYKYEKDKQWGKTYYYRTPKFCKTVPYKYYVEQMNKDSEGWKLINYQILSYEEKNKKAYIKIRFIEEIPKNFVSSKWPSKKVKKIKSIEESKWIKINETWYCSNACSRFHLSFNNEIVQE